MGVTALKRLLRVDDPCDVFGVHGRVQYRRLYHAGIFAREIAGRWVTLRR